MLSKLRQTTRAALMHLKRDRFQALAGVGYGSTFC
jgi:hypothetical protein